jgi:hypothetical protein
VKRRLFSVLTTACLLGGLTMVGPASHNASAQDESDVKYEIFGKGLNGSYAFQFNGSIFLPPPFDTFDGPFARNGRVVFDGKGSFHTTTVTVNYGGTVSHETFSGTYKQFSDGTFTLSIPNLKVPFLPPNTPNVFSFEGVLGNEGKIAKVALSGVSIFGQDQPNIGSVITGELVRQ